VEINGTFYSLQRPEYFERWAAEVPDDFVFRSERPALRHPQQEAQRRRGPARQLLRQRPPEARAQARAPSSGSCRRCSASTRSGWRASSKSCRATRRRSPASQCLHDQRVAGRACLEPEANRRVRHCLEIRHKSFEDPRFIELLREHDIGLVCADTVDWPLLMDVTSDFVYCRLHGSEELYVSGYEDEALQRWAVRVAAWAQGGEPADAIRVIDAPGPQLPTRDVYVFFDNDVKVRAPFDALGLAARVDERLS
jgi:uncharacterized protein YecE (DUF72 family)